MSINTIHTVGEQLEGPVLYARQKALRDAANSPPGPTIVAADLQVPENMGSVLRLADAAGSRHVIFVSQAATAVQTYASRVHRTARNAESWIDTQVFDEPSFIRMAGTLRPLIAIEITTHSKSLFEVVLPESCAIMIGNERHGIPKQLLAECDDAIHVPMYGVNGSMNVTHALAIALFEWRRQHHG